MKERIYYFDRLRIVSILAVFVIHISAEGLFSCSIGSVAWNLYNILDSLSRFAVPIFVMISGALFLDREKELSFKLLYEKNILRIICSFVFWSFAYALVFSGGDVEVFVGAFLNGHYHMWFLKMLLGIYIFIPVFRKICEDARVMQYFLIASASVCFAFFFLLKFSIVSSEFLPPEGFLKALGYSAYFIGGYYLSRVDISKAHRGIIYFIGILGFIITVFLTHLLSVRDMAVNASVYSYFSLTVLGMSVAVFVFAKYNLNRTPNSEVAKRSLLQFSKTTFGAYLVHIFIIEIINKSGFLVPVGNIVVYVALKIIMTSVISFGISYLMNKLPYVNKYIV